MPQTPLARVFWPRARIVVTGEAVHLLGAEVAHGPNTLDRLAEGLDAGAAMAAVLAADEQAGYRQLGVVDAGGGSAVGLSVSYLGVNTDTAAYIGDNHGDIRPGPFSSNDPFAGNGGGSGFVNADNL